MTEVLSIFMLFSIVKLIVWLAGVGVIAYYVLPYFGYEVNTDYFRDRKIVCQEQIEQCRKDLIRDGLAGAREKCDIQCVDPAVLIKAVNKKQSTVNNEE